MRGTLVWAELNPQGARIKIHHIHQQRCAMPQYEYFCHSCQKVFSQTLTLQEYEEGEITCPDCGSKEVEQTLTAFFAVGSKKS